MLKSVLIAVAAVALAAPVTAFAQATPVGLWKTIDDETKQEKSLVRISDNAGVLTGTIEKLIDPTKQNEVCGKCTDERKDKPLVGLAIVRNAKQDAEDKTLWTGGDITDPNNGKVYKLRLKPADGGKALEVRGYLGAPMFGRTQTWIRVE